jgi:geranylgeranyl reductase
MGLHKVVIVGAGPAGLKAAELLAKANKDVLVIEKEKEEGIGDKPCAGGLFPHSMQYFPKELLENIIDSITFHIGERNLVVNFDNPIVAMVSRLRIGQYQLKLAKENGAQIMANTKVKGLDKERNEVILKSGERIGYKYLIAADGSTSVIRKVLGFKSDLFMQGIEFPLPIDFNELEVSIDLKKYSLTYYWIFPHKGYASVGTAVFPQLQSVKETKERFNKWATEKDIDLTKTKMRAHPLYFGYHGFKHGNIFLTGDAASFTCPLDGEGIYQAIKSGEIAAKVIIDPNWNYKFELKNLLKFHKYGMLFLPWVNNFPRILRNAIKNLGDFYTSLSSITFSIIGSSKLVQRATFGRLIE